MTFVPVRVEVRPELLVWARERAGLSTDDLARRFPRLFEWEAGRIAPTLRQLERFATATKAPLGYLLLQEPPDEPLPIPDYRTMGGGRVQRPSPDLLDTIFVCQQRQEWYREFAEDAGQDAVAVVGLFTRTAPVEAAAQAMREALAFEVEGRGRTWTDALRTLVDHAEELGILVMVNGVVGNNTHRTLDPQEFRGFALVDRLAPVVFVNGRDTKAAQIFTLAHELAHVWIGESALSDVDPAAIPDEAVERWCNQVAAELLVPLEAIQANFGPQEELTGELQRLAEYFKVSTLVVLRRVREAGLMGWDEYRAAYEAELERVREFLDEPREGGGGGDFYNTQPVRASRRFTRALISSTLAGQTLYRDAFRMLGVRKVATFDELATRVREG
jgi:Zn-dependent peptidase ImmA (M78 family)